jgi:hypothetical protein
MTHPAVNEGSMASVPSTCGRIDYEANNYTRLVAIQVRSLPAEAALIECGGTRHDEVVVTRSEHLQCNLK